MVIIPLNVMKISNFVLFENFIFSSFWWIYWKILCILVFVLFDNVMLIFIDGKIDKIEQLWMMIMQRNSIQSGLVDSLSATVSFAGEIAPSIEFLQRPLLQVKDSKETKAKVFHWGSKLNKLLYSTASWEEKSSYEGTVCEKVDF